MSEPGGRSWPERPPERETGSRTEFRFPDVGEGLDEGGVVAWLVAEGDVVERDQPLVEVQTDKSMVVLPSPVAGRVVRLAASPGDIVKVGAVLVVLESGGVPASSEAISTPTAARPKAAPSVRKLALELGVDLATVTGTGPGGRILATDLPPAGGGPGRQILATDLAPVGGVPGGSPSLAPDASSGRHPLRGVRKAMAESMARSWREVPHLSTFDEVDATALVAARKALAGGASPAVTVGVLLLAATARAVARHPMLNATLHAQAGEYTVHETVGLGMAVATPAGLVVAVIHDAAALGLADLTAEAGRLAAAARAGRLAPADVASGTFTVTNFGALGGRFATPVIRPPEVGIAGFGAIAARPFVVGEAVVARRTLPVCCSFDHRLVDGALASAFVATLISLLTEPAQLLPGG